MKGKPLAPATGQGGSDLLHCIRVQAMAGGHHTLYVWLRVWGVTREAQHDVR